MGLRHIHYPTLPKYLETGEDKSQTKLTIFYFFFKSGISYGFILFPHTYLNRFKITYCIFLLCTQPHTAFTQVITKMRGAHTKDLFRLSLCLAPTHANLYLAQVEARSRNSPDACFPISSRVKKPLGKIPKSKSYGHQHSKNGRSYLAENYTRNLMAQEFS